MGSKDQIAGRTREKNVLKQLINSGKPEFLALYGRRRVGKTYLIRQFFANEDALFFNITGSKDGSMHEQINHFTWQMADTFYGGAKLSPEKNWDEVFRQLTQAFARIASKKKIVLFFDELPWMATKRSRLLQNLDYYWNQHWSNDNRIKLIICGSSASWIIHKILKNKGGLYNRVTRKIFLEPFNLLETKNFLDSLGVKLNKQQVLLFYMVTGGVPYYLMQAEKGLSAMQLIERLAFSKNAFLLDEFENLFDSLFDNGDMYTQLVKIISKHRHGIGQRELLETVGKQVLGGAGVRKLRDLEEAGFIMSFKPLYHKKKGIYYRLIDEYTLFYLKWIDPIRNNLQERALKKGNWQEMQQTPEWNNWLGYAFESVCYKHLPEIRERLELGPTAVADSWRYVPRKGSTRRGAQIDLLFDRKDNAITLCEIKYSDKPFVLTKSYVEILQRKTAVFQEQTHTKKQIFTALISASGVKNNYYADDILSGIVTLSDLYEE